MIEILQENARLPQITNSPVNLASNLPLLNSSARKMVSYYEDGDDSTSFRRFNSRGHGYPLSHDREHFSTTGHALHPAGRNHQVAVHEPRTAGLSPESDINSRPRSRIPVACGRCRKRKIRCSGDTGGPCTNCKNAGNESCQFLRVSSTEAQMKIESAGYDYDPSGSAASRLNCRMIPYGPQFPPHTAPISLDGYPYRNNSLSSYQYQVKPFYSMPAYGDFGDEGVDYGLQSQLIGADHLGMAMPNYTISNTARGWTPGPQVPKAPLYIEHSDTPYNHGQLPFHGGSYPPRASLSSEPKNTPLNGMGTTLPPTINACTPINSSLDRTLPFPSANRTAQMGPFLRSADGLPSTATLHSQSYTDYHLVRGIKKIGNTAPHDNASMSSSYALSNQSTSPETLSSSQMAYGSQPPMNMSQQGVSFNSPPSDDLYSVSAATTGSSGSPYRHSSSEGSKRGSHSSHGSTGDSSLPSITGGRLANDREYQFPTMPYSSNHNFTMPPVIHQPTPVSRTSITVHE